MREELSKLEADAEAQMAQIAALLNVAPEPGFIARVRAAVEREAFAFGRRRRWMRIGSAWAAAAAVVLLSLSLRARVAEPLDVYADVAPGTVLDAWIDASAETGDSFTALYDDSWLAGDAAYDDEDAADDALDSIDQSFEAFESIFGA